MEPDLSEFSYGFALTSELVATYRLKRAGAPEFATQIAEAKAGGGWDMKLPGLPVFLQFKRSDSMVRRSAWESRLFATLPFFRMHLRSRRHSRQHELLLDLESHGNVVLYAAPGFTTPLELSGAFTSDTVVSQSIFVRPSAIGPLRDDNLHHVAFQLPAPAYFCSEPKPIETENIHLLLSEVLPGRMKMLPPQPAAQFFIHVADQLLDTYKRKAEELEDEGFEDQILEDERFDALRELRQRREPAEYAALIARTLFDLDFLVLPRG